MYEFDCHAWILPRNRVRNTNVRQGQQAFLQSGYSAKVVVEGLKEFPILVIQSEAAIELRR